MLSLFVYDRDGQKAVRLNERCIMHIEKSGKQIDRNDCFDNSDKLSDMIKSFDGTSLYMLRNETGLGSIAENIRTANDGNYIVLVLKNPEEMFEAVTPSVRPSGLMLEDTEDRRFKGIIDEIFADYERVNKPADSDCYSFRSKGQEFSTQFSSIILIEVQSKKIKLYTESQVYEFYDTLDSVLSRVPEYFLRIHRSYVVNANYIRLINYKDKTIFMKDESHIFFSRTYMSNIKNYFKNTLKESFF